MRNTKGKNNDKANAADRMIRNLLEAHEVLAEARDCLEGIVSECGNEELDRYAKGGAAIFERIDRSLILVKGTAVSIAGGKPAEGYWELMIRKTYENGESPVTIACRTVEKARELMEKDIQETLAVKSPKYEPEDLVRIDENNVRLGYELIYEIEWKELVG